MVFLKQVTNHFTNVWHIFETCHKYKISLNPKKSIFVVTKGNILQYIISKYGNVSDPKRTKEMNSIVYPNNKKEMQSCLGNINFVRRFISRFAEIVKPLQNMIKKDVKFK